MERNKFLGRGLAAAVILLSALATLMAYRHLVPKEIPKLLSFNHQVRRELARAERINLRTGVNYEEGAILPHLGNLSFTLSDWSQTVARPLEIVKVFPDLPTQSAVAHLHRSTVLNL
ncbi:MAG TPA: hypothetical protein VE131_13690 [Terriglobales bacterium]|nr:hypothetical protein [Terriglobales bacterium]